jgi:hypothetical protein
MTRENAAGKARRLLAEGRVVVTRVEGTHIDATVRGDTAAFYSVRHRSGSWSCSCPSVGRCSHLAAVMLVTAPVGSWIAASYAESAFTTSADSEYEPGTERTPNLPRTPQRGSCDDAVRARDIHFASANRAHPSAQGYLRHDELAVSVSDEHAAG